LVSEHYYLVCLKSALDQTATQALLAVLKSAAWQEQVAGIAGYAPSRSGEVLAMHKVLPWWDFKRKKAG
ncbi:MAG: LysR family transcriptional regulator, partial [Burkholderiaceae bacterium]|nr:LysR family transcriptional regulator [Burkholderiaceae bacterium]